MYTPQETLSYKLLVLGTSMREECKDILDTLGLTYGNYFTMLYIYNNPGITQVKLAELNHRDRNVIGRVVDTLEKLGYARREKSPSDRRVYMLYLTDKGVEAAEKYWPRILEAEENAVAIYSEEEQQSLQYLLDKAVRLYRG